MAGQYVERRCFACGLGERTAILTLNEPMFVEDSMALKEYIIEDGGDADVILFDQIGPADLSGYDNIMINSHGQANALAIGPGRLVDGSELGSMLRSHGFEGADKEIIVEACYGGASDEQGRSLAGGVQSATGAVAYGAVADPTAGPAFIFLPTPKEPFTVTEEHLGTTFVVDGKDTGGNTFGLRPGTVAALPSSEPLILKNHPELAGMTHTVDHYRSTVIINGRYHRFPER